MSQQTSSFKLLGIDRFELRNIFSEFIPEFSISSMDAGIYTPSSLVKSEFSVQFIPKIRVLLSCGLRYEELLDNFKSGEYDQFFDDIKHRLTIYDLEIQNSKFNGGVKINGNQLEILIYSK